MKSSNGAWPLKKVFPKNLVLLLLAQFIFLFWNCKNDKGVQYSFFVAGHVYGKPRGGELGVYDSLKMRFDLINTYRNMKFGVFTGDIVRSANEKSWDAIDDDLKTLKVPVYFSRGNHDGELSFFEERYGESYKSFITEGDLHIILDSNIGHWNIEGEQRDFLIRTLMEDSSKVNNIFIYVHHVIWWQGKGFLRPNSRAGMSEKLTFWTEIAPILNVTNKPVFIFAGDVGAAANTSYSYERSKNLTLITSGMGGGVRDNFVIVDILNDSSVQFHLIALNGGDVHGLGKLKED
ncbi:metallophosphoesterase family protein [Ulvibacterium sp.]|uniref:metallophosphoesterase family protein n=1 Tax=Ulvibacterium sp. TaxID=2665914 RepID=UPI003BADADEE